MTEQPFHDGPKRRAASGRGGRVLLVGARRHLRRLAGCLDQEPWSALPVVGYVDLSGRGRQLVVHPRSNPVPILGRLDRLADLISRTGATDLVIALSDRPARRRRSQIGTLLDESIRVHWVDHRVATHPDALQRPPRWAVGRPPWPLLWSRILKRMLDIVGASLGLILLSPLLIIVALVIWITTGRPVFYTQERVGQGGRLFRIWKFRSMRTDAERETGPIWASLHDTRCTRVGEWLRETNIDELPQLFNVLRGDMSLVGPRPERPVFVEQFRRELPDYDYRHAVPAGMTGWAQVHGWRGRTSLRKRLQYDLDYIRRWSFWLDVRILFMTIQHVACGKTKWSGGAGRRRRIR
jgi:undecaprenyl-phosphate glucose phosphotransferase